LETALPAFATASTVVSLVADLVVVVVLVVMERVA